MKRTVLSVLVILMVTLCLPFNASAAGTNISNSTKFTIPNTRGNDPTVGTATVYASMVSDPGSGQCWAYANSIYSKIWGVNFASDFTGSKTAGWNYLRSLSDSQRALTASNTQKFISAAPLGAVIRVQSCPSSCSKFGNDGLACGHDGHSLVLVAKSSTGFTVLQRDSAVHATTYTWSNFASTWANWKYFKYIKWPGARDATWAETSLVGLYKLKEARPAKHDPYDASITLSGYNTGDVVNVVASITNGGGSVWYKLADGTYIYSGALEPITQAYELDVNFIYNGQEITETADMVSFDIQMGSEAYYGCHDFWRTDIPAGTSYQISSLSGKNGYQVTGYSGSLSGTINSNTVIWIYLEDAPTTYNLGVYVIYNDQVSQTLATYDLTVGDTTYYQISNYSASGLAPGTYYEISNVKNKYVGYYVTSYGPISGYLYSDTDIIIEMVDCQHPDWDEEILETSGCTWQKYRKTCVLCGYYSVEQRGDLNHTWVDVPYVGAGCTTEGHTAMSYCSTCGFTVGGEVIPAKGHTLVKDAAVAATCTAAGKTEGSHCSVCGEMITAQTTIPAKGHTPVTDAAVAATCTTAGKTEGSHCSVCGAVITAQTTVAALGHNAGDWVTVTEATTSTKGLREKRCTRCGIVLETEEIPAVVAPVDDIDAPSVKTVSAKKGETVTLSVYINAKNASMVTINCSWDASVFEFVSSECTEGQCTNGTFSMYSLTGTINGKIGTITLRLKNDIADGTFKVTANVREAYDIDENTVACKAAVDNVKVSSRVPGDVTGDGTVDGRDLLRLAKYLGGYDVSIVEDNSTVNGDTVVDGRDLLRLAKYLGGYSVELQ